MYASEILQKKINNPHEAYVLPYAPILKLQRVLAILSTRYICRTLPENKAPNDSYASDLSQDLL